MRIDLLKAVGTVVLATLAPICHASDWIHIGISADGKTSLQVDLESLRPGPAGEWMLWTGWNYTAKRKNGEAPGEYESMRQLWQINCLDLSYIRKSTAYYEGRFGTGRSLGGFPSSDPRSANPPPDSMAEAAVKFACDSKFRLATVASWRSEVEASLPDAAASSAR